MRRTWPLVTAGLAAAACLVGGGAWAMTADQHHAAPTASVASESSKASVAGVSTFAAPASASGVKGNAANAKAGAKPISDLLKPGQLLKAGKYRRSANGKYLLAQQTDGNLVLYRGHTALWSTQTKGHGLFTAMQTDGNLVVYRGHTALWSTRTGRNPGATLAVQNDANLVIYGRHSRPLWWRAISIEQLDPGYVLRPGQSVVSPSMRYFLQMQTDGNLVLYKGSLLNKAPKTARWSSRTKGSGAFAAMQTDGNLVVYRGRTPLWSSVTGRHPGAFLEMQNDGNLVVYQGHTPLWFTSTTGR